MCQELCWDYRYNHKRASAVPTLGFQKQASESCTDDSLGMIMIKTMEKKMMMMMMYKV